MLQSQERTYLSGVNILRGLLSLSVLLWHYQHFWVGSSDFDYTTQPWFSLLRVPYTRGYDAVPVFWMVSGVVLANAYFTTLHKGRLVSYIKARIARLYPLHFVTLTVIAALQLLGDSPQIYGNNDTKHFFLNFFFIPWWGFEDGFSFNAPIWSVSIEIPIYVAFALLIYRLPNRARIWLVGSVLITIYIFNSYRPDLLGQIGIKSDFVDCAAYFFTGIMISRIVRISSRRSALFWLVLSLGTLAILGLDSGNWLFGTSVVLSTLAIASGSLSQLFNSRILRTFGELTYSVFLWHVPIQILIRWFLIETGANNQYFGSIRLLAGYLFATYFVGYFSFKYIEEPMRHMLRKSSTPPRQAASRAT
jgi:peptidoglycan/LPS O-acetylase OafA/YrhL